MRQTNKYGHIFSLCVRLLLMLDQGTYNRRQMAEELHVSGPTVARYLALFRTKLQIEITFLASVPKKTEIPRKRGRLGVMVVSNWGRVNRRKTIRFCRLYMEGTSGNDNPGIVDLLGVLLSIS